MVKIVPMRIVTEAFMAEFEKVGKRTAMQLLSSLAARKGLDPGKIGAIKQVGTIAEAGNRPRAAEIAQNLRSYLKSPPASQRAA